MGQTKQLSRILIAEESLLFRRGLVALFASDPALSVVGEARDANEVLTRIQEFKPTALVIDAAILSASENDELATAIRQAQPGLRILVLAQQDTESYMAAAISSGAKGLILKSAPAAELMAAFRSVAFGEGGMNASGLLPEFQALAKRTRTASSNSVLTAREQEVVRLLAEGKTVRSVANELSLSMKTVEAHKLNLMRKLDIHNRASLIAYASRTGLVAAEAQ